MIWRARRTLSKRKRGQYEIFETLGHGGFATVRLGKHIRLGTRAAVKELHVPLGREQVEQFFHEAYISARLVHPNIVRVLDYNVEDGIPFLVMDYAPNGTLRHLHPDGTRLPLRTIVSYVKQLAAGLQYAHNRYVIHCDVKPENMLVGRNGEILLSDFGIAKIAGAHERDKAVGTLPYMAPEQIDGTPCAESDQYAVAMVVYEWLSGSCPFQGSREEIIYQHRYIAPPSLREQLPALPVAVEQVIMKALSKKPAQRYPSISAFATALEQASRTTITGTSRFNPDDVQKRMLLQRIAGKRKEEAIAQLSKLPGVQAVIQPTWRKLLPGDMLPTNLNQMILVVMHVGR